jgi:hypothetical protein
MHFTLHSDELPAVQRSFDSFSQAAQENGAAGFTSGSTGTSTTSKAKPWGEKSLIGRSATPFSPGTTTGSRV